MLPKLSRPTKKQRLTGPSRLNRNEKKLILFGKGRLEATRRMAEAAARTKLLQVRTTNVAGETGVKRIGDKIRAITAHVGTLDSDNTLVRKDIKGLSQIYKNYQNNLTELRTDAITAGLSQQRMTLLASMDVLCALVQKCYDLAGPVEREMLRAQIREQDNLVESLKSEQQSVTRLLTAACIKEGDTALGLHHERAAANTKELQATTQKLDLLLSHRRLAHRADRYAK
ncbi:hypothetical protein ACN47E_003342 [Coniothyrium glycines]